MRPPARIPLRFLPRLVRTPAPFRPIHSTVSAAANVAPIVGTGPPPEPPIPASRNATERVERRKKHAELLKNAKEFSKEKGGKGGALKKRFWKNVGVEEVDGEFATRRWKASILRPGSTGALQALTER